MVVLNFTLSPEAASKVHDLLVCLAKFSDTVALEARPNSLSFTALNPSKSAYAAITLGDRQPFFEHYEFVPSQRSEGRFTCGMYIKALLSVFRGRLFDPQGRDGAIDHCEVSVQESPNEAQCRFTVKMICNQGIIKTYRLTYEAVDVLHAMFDRTAAKNKWTMHASAIREYTEYFGTKTEMLDLFAGEDGRCVFKSYTEKISNGKEILKHPLVTAVAVNTSDFAEFKVQPGLHIIVSVKDFKAIVAHADVLKTTLKAQFSQPTRPLQFSYESGGLSAEFTLMTSGDVNAIPPSPTPAPHRNASRQASHKSTSGRAESRSSRPDMPPPSQPASRRDRLGRLRNPGSRQSSSSTETATAQQDADSLFVPDDTEEARRREDEEDLQWAPRDYDREETLGWDANADMDASIFPTFRDSGNMPKRTAAEDNEVFEPTQRVSQMKNFALW